MKIKNDVTYRQDLENRVALKIAYDVLEDSERVNILGKKHIMLARVIKLALERNRDFAAKHESYFISEQNNIWLNMSVVNRNLYKHWQLMFTSNMGKRELGSMVDKFHAVSFSGEKMANDLVKSSKE